jgi:hypothetical protein
LEWRFEPGIEALTGWIKDLGIGPIVFFPNPERSAAHSYFARESDLPTARRILSHKSGLNQSGGRLAPEEGVVKKCTSILTLDHCGFGSFFLLRHRALSIA